MNKRNLPIIMTLALLLATLPLLSRSASAALIYTSGRPLAPAVAYSPRTNTYLLVWAEDRDLGTGLDLYAVRLTTSGIVAGGVVPLVIEPEDQSDPALAWSEQLDSFFVVYTQTGSTVTNPTPGLPTPGAPGTPGPAPTAGGTPPPFPTPPGPPIPLLLNAGDGVMGRESIGAVGLHSAGVMGAFGVQARERTFGSESADWAYVSASGAAASPAQPTFPPPPPPFPTPGPSSTPVNTAVPPPPGSSPTPTTAGGPPPPPPVAPGQRDIYGVWSSEGGIALTNTFPIISSPADDTFPTLAYHQTPTTDVWALVWREVTGTTATIGGIRLTGYGRFLSYTSGKATIAMGADHGRPSIALESSGEYLVVWSETPTGAGQRDIFARRLNSNAWPRGRAITIVEGVEDQVYPSVASGSAGDGYLVAWEQRATGQPPDIRMRRLNRNGIPLRASYDVAGGPPFSFAPNLPSTDRPTRLLVWVDRNAASDHAILGTEITGDGRPLGPTRMLVQGGAGPGAVTPVHPPPTFPTLPPLPPFPPIPPIP